MRSLSTSTLRIEAIDNYHPAWDSVMMLIQQVGQREALNLDPDGWLPARQVLLAGFFQTKVAGFICFSIVPRIENGDISLLAQLECLGMANEYSHQSVEHDLVQAAQIRAADLKCQGALAA